MNSLREDYKKRIVAELKKEFDYSNDFAVPNLKKIIINSGVGESITNASVMERVEEDIRVISGQKPLRTKSKKAISNFKIRKGQEIGVMVTLRGERMWDFYQKLVSIVLPRVRDFRGVERKFDGNGNYTLGVKEYSVFPEVDLTKMDKIRGLQIVIATTAKTDKEAEALLLKLGMPFKKLK